MMSQGESLLITELGDGLVLRQATLADADALSTFNAHIHQHEGSKEPDERVGMWTRDLMTRPHPTFKISDFTLVEEVDTKRIVSSLGLISQTWSYAGIHFKAGRPELVGTDPEFRGQGLIRAQFEVIHRWSADRGEMVLGITGIPYYYRLFGYEMALNLGGGRAGFKPQIPELKGDEPYQLRPAEESDLPFLAELDLSANKRYLVSCVRDEEMWAYELNGKSPENVNYEVIRIIESQSDGIVGYVVHPPYRWGAMMPAISYEVKPGISWASVTPSVIRYLQSTGEAYSTEDGKDVDFEAFGFWLGGEHPVYQVIPNRLSRVRHPYAWYLRVPDLPGFIKLITPELEKRLADSPMVGHSGELKITFYGEGIRLMFENGRLVEVEEWKPEPILNSGDAGFPELTFLQLLFGYRDLSELRYAFADCWAKEDQAAVLLDILFPKRVSQVWPVS
jgi:GNAT superfamily N-acetyltransferase